MDNLYYVMIAQAVIIFTIIVAVLFVTLKLIRRNKFSKKDAIIIFLLIVCTYLYLPFHLDKKGLECSYPEKYHKAIDYYNKALKLSVIPYERKMLKYDLGCLYYFYDEDGNRAIKYMEEASDRDYSHAFILPHLYFLKGDYDKVREIEDSIDGSNHYYTALSDIMSGNYDEELDILSKLEPVRHTDYMLISAIYKEIGRNKEAEEYYNKAIEFFDSIVFSNELLKQEQYNKLLEYSSIEKFKEHTLNQRNEYGFID